MYFLPIVGDFKFSTLVNKNEYVFIVHLPRKKKEPIDECKDSFFLGVWDIVTSSLFSPNRNVTFRQFLGTTCTK